MKRLNNIILAAGLLFSLYFFIKQASFNSPIIYLVALFLGAWVAFPYIFLGIFNNRVFKQTSAHNALLPWALIITAATYIYHEAFSGQQDAQSALIFVVLPVYQLAACLPAIFIGRYFEKRSK